MIFKVGDRVKLVELHPLDPKRLKIGMEGTLIKLSPGINGFGVEFEDGLSVNIFESQLELVEPDQTPSHYMHLGMEVWEIAERIFGKEAMIQHLRISALEYRLRAGRKEGNDAVKDIEKAISCENKAKQLTQN